MKPVQRSNELLAIDIKSSQRHKINLSQEILQKLCLDNRQLSPHSADCRGLVRLLKAILQVCVMDGVCKMMCKNHTKSI